MLRTFQPAAPNGFDCMRIGGTLVWARPEMKDWAEEAVVRHGSLYAMARLRSAGTVGLAGRAPVYVVQSDSIDRVVRHYVRGGMVASLLGDRYLRMGTWRPLREAAASERLRSIGLPTPKVLAAAVYLAGPVYRGDLVTEYVPTDGDLARILFNEEPPATVDLRTAALRTVGATIRRISSLGVLHPDVNAKNFLVDAGASPPRIHLLDLDRCRLGRVSAESDTQRMGDRLTRSLRKWEGRSGRRLTSHEWEALRDGLEDRSAPSAGAPADPNSV